MSKSKKELMQEIRDEVVNLTGSPLYEYRVQNNYYPVIGEGSHDAQIMFIGEAPGVNEAMTGRPFCGAAGKVLDELLASIDVPRKDVYIANVLKDRPPENRDPTAEEIKMYAPFLDGQIDIIQPKVIATLGRYSMEYIMRKFGLEKELQPISKIHGKVFNLSSLFGERVIVPLYHPAVATYNRNEMGVLREDFRVLKNYI